MATKTTIALEDDLDGGPADETVQFCLGTADYEIDLSARNADEFRTQMAPFIEHARRSIRPHRPATRRATVRQHSAGVRAWAREHGLDIGNRGRIPASINEQYQAAITRS
jgi:hypothetical protein